MNKYLMDNLSFITHKDLTGCTCQENSDFSIQTLRVAYV